MMLRKLGAGVVESALKVPVSVKVMGIAVGLILTLGGTLLWQINTSWHRLLLKELETRGRLLATNLATHGVESVLARRDYQLRALLEDVRDHAVEVDYVLVLDKRGEVVAHTLSGAPSRELLAANAPAHDGKPRVALLDTDGGPVRDVAVAMLGGAAGSIRVGMSEKLISTEVSWLTRRLAIVTALVAGLGVFVAVLLTAILTRPIRELARLTLAVRDEDYSKRAAVRAGDELGVLAIAFNEMAEALQRKEAAREGLLRQLLAAAEDERKRVARELHDGTGQSLTSLIAGLGALESESGEGELRGRLTELRALAAQTLGEVHDIARTLRPALLDDLGLPEALRRHCELFSRRFGIVVDCQDVGFESRRRLTPEIELTAYRIVQEALTNSVRHSQARSTSVLVHRKERTILLIIEDDGQGFFADGWRARALEEGQLGLLGIEERAALLGGSLRVESAPGSGTRLFVEIPAPGGSHDA